MKIKKRHQNSRKTACLLASLSIAMFLVMNPLAAHGEEISEFKKFQFELYAGYTSINPSDLNLFVDYENRIQEFSYDRYLNFLQANGQIQTWAMNQQEGERREIKRAYPLGFRLKYFLNKTIAISLGFKYMTSKQESDLDFQYTRDELIEEQYIESLAYSPFSISTKAYMPLVGIHIVKRFRNALELEGYITGGPMFVKCHYLSDWMYEWRIQGPDYGYIVASRIGRLEQNGSGTGIAIDFGGRLSYPIAKIMAIFLEGGYAYQVAKNPSGSGLETQGTSNVTWNGEWSIKQETMEAAWGEIDLELPTNYWPNNTAEGRSRDFKLDLSGFQFRLGLSLRF
ncbi:hypothetical protein ACFLT2_02360 [Acidobacteriota bacterium]